MIGPCLPLAEGCTVGTRRTSTTNKLRACRRTYGQVHETLDSKPEQSRLGLDLRLEVLYIMVRFVVRVCHRLLQGCRPRATALEGTKDGDGDGMTMGGKERESEGVRD